VYQIVGEPGAGKSQAVLLDALIVATGLERILRGPGNISNERLHLSGPVIVYNAEDRLFEMKRRLVTLQAHFGLTDADMKHPIILWSGVEKTLTVLTKSDKHGILRAPGSTELRGLIRKHSAVLVALDPQISLATGINESSNDDMNALLQELANIASETDCCIEIVHHTSKQTRQNAGDMGAGRGAFAAVGKVRSASTLTNVLGDEDEVKGLGITSDDAIVMLKTAKLSHSDKRRFPPVFFRKISANVGNGRGLVNSHPFDGSELSPRERLQIEGDQAPILELVDVSKLAAKAGAAKLAVNEHTATTIAQIVDVVMGNRDQCEFNDVWDVIGERLRENGLTNAKARQNIRPLIVNPLLGGGRQIERNGQIVRIRVAQKSHGKTAPWVLFRDNPDNLSEGN
jgi:AAA domain